MDGSNPGTSNPGTRGDAQGEEVGGAILDLAPVSALRSWPRCCASTTSRSWCPHSSTTCGATAASSTRNGCRTRYSPSTPSSTLCSARTRTTGRRGVDLSRLARGKCTRIAPCSCAATRASCGSKASHGSQQASRPSNHGLCIKDSKFFINLRLGMDEIKWCKVSGGARG